MKPTRFALLLLLAAALLSAGPAAADSAVVAPDGTLYFADIGIVISDDGIGPGDGTGKVRKIRFVDGEPQPPETIAEDLAFPDGIGIYVPKKGDLLDQKSG